MLLVNFALREPSCSGVDTPQSRRFTPKAVVYHAGTSMSHTHTHTSTGKLYWTFDFFVCLFQCCFLLKCKTERPFFPSQSLSRPKNKQKKKNTRIIATVLQLLKGIRAIFSMIIPIRSLICIVATFPTGKCENKLLTRRKSGASQMLHNSYSDNF